MVKSEQANNSEMFSDETVSLSPFAIKKMGLISNQSLLKVDTYSLVCVPYKISMKGVVLLGSFSRDEFLFFQRFIGSLAGLSLVFHPSDSRAPLKVFCRCSLSQFGPMKGRESVGLISANFKPCPPDLISAIENYLMFVKRLHVDHKELSGKTIPINPETARVMGFNNYATLSAGPVATKLALYSLSANKIEFLAPMQTPDLQKGQAVILRLFFQKYQFNVSGRVTESRRLPTGVQRGFLDIDFSPELVDLLNLYYLQTKLGTKRPGKSS